jgi:hypothetical protein
LAESVDTVDTGCYCRYMTTREIDPAAFEAAKTITQVAASLGYSWSEWAAAPIAERDDAVLAAKSGATTFTARAAYPTNDELNATILAALRRA